MKSFVLLLLSKYFEFFFFFVNIIFSISDCLKVKLSLYRPWRPIGLREVEAPTFSDIRLTDGGKVVNTTSQPPFTPQ
jgi:hypothetical protein